MRVSLFILFTIIAGFIAQLFMPWWSIVIIAGILSFIFDIKVGASFWAGFVASALLWGGYACWLNSGNEGILAARIGALIGDIGSTGLLVATAIIGGFFGALGALIGILGRVLLQPA